MWYIRNVAYEKKKDAIKAVKEVIIPFLKIIRLVKGLHTHSFRTATYAPIVAENVPARSTDRDRERKHIQVIGGSCSVAA